MTSARESLAPEQSRAARALLAWSQQELAAAARVATSTVADFERGSRTPVANNAQAIRNAFESNGLRFIAGGVVEAEMLPKPAAEPRAGALVRWVNATHLSEWGERRDGQGGMPELLSRLIYAACGPSASLRFPSDESVQHSGYDGTCDTQVGTRYVPAGSSVWEVGTQRKSIGAKADEDFSKRSADPLGKVPQETTFVFVTSRRFPKKDAWVAACRSTGPWANVVALDGDDLVHWLEACPAVAQWLSVRIGRRPEGIRNLEDAWAEWIRATDTPLTPSVVMASRDEDQAAVLKWLRGPPCVLSVQAEAPDEALAFLCAAISPLPDRYRKSYWSRCIVADTPETARQLVGLGTPLIVAAAELDGGIAQRLVEDGHHVFSAYGPDFGVTGAVRRLARPWRSDLQAALVEAGVDDEQAHRLAHASGRSVTVLRRIMPAAPGRGPSWARPASRELVAAMFAGGWVETSRADRTIIAGMAGCDYEAAEAQLSRHAGLDQPLVKLGPVWKVSSLRDLWTQVGGQVTASQLERFGAAFSAVLGATNPRYDTRPKSKYYEAEGEFGDEASGPLRRGLTEAMVAMAVFPDRAELIPDVGGWVERAIRTLLQGAGPALWWSLAKDFQNLAEASPRAFLEALEDGLAGNAPPVTALFRNDEGFMDRTEYLSNLLWALEMLARSSEHIMDAALILARLDELDPGGTWGNRPFASLRRVFVTWSPQTYATPSERLKVIDRIVGRHPTVGWKLLLGLAPRFHDTVTPSSSPNWRNFGQSEPEGVTWASVAEAATAIGNRLLEAAGDDAARWRALLGHWSDFAPAWRAKATKRLSAFVGRLNDPVETEAMRDEVRALLNKHRSFHDADWAMAEESLRPLDTVLADLQPEGVEDRVRWLFKDSAFAPGVGHDWEAQQSGLAALRAGAAEELLAHLPTSGLLAFSATVQAHHALGVAIATAGVPDAKKHEILGYGLRANEQGLADLASGILGGLRVRAGDNGVSVTQALWRSAIDGGWKERAELRIVEHLPPEPSTWNALAARSEALSLSYWRTLPVYSIPGDVEAAWVVDRLVEAGRARDALGWLGHNIGTDPGTELVIRTLAASITSEQVAEGNAAAMLGHWLSVLFGYLDGRPDANEHEIVKLEWAYFQSLRYSQRPARTLHRALARDPAFFVHLLKLIYMPADDSGIVEPEPESLEAARGLASQAYDVLHDWKHVPGADDQGTIDPVALEAWVKHARKLLAAAGRSDIGDSKIGEILSAATREGDGPWPPRAVCEVMELARSRVLERGFEVGVYNRRGVTTRIPRDGGKQERELSKRYKQDADAIGLEWPRASACLHRIAETYNVDAMRKDLSAEQRDWL